MAKGNGKKGGPGRGNKSVTGQRPDGRRNPAGAMKGVKKRSFE